MTQNDNPKRDDDALQRLSGLQRLGQALFEREAGRLARKHGMDDLRVQRMIRTASGAGKMLSALEVARDAAPQDVKAAQDEIVVYGRVAHDDLKGVANVEVTIEDTSGRVRRAAGSATTDVSGRFTLRIPPGVADRLAGKDYIITARDSKGAIIYRAANTIRLDVNQAIKADVHLGARTPIRRPSPVKPVRPERSPQPNELAVFSVSGQVVDANGNPVAGVLVRIYDKDVKYDDLLGATLTNRQGEFGTTYRRQDFSEGEDAADLYFVVVDADEKELLSTVTQVKFSADREVSVTLTLPKLGER
jgi:hypothetical protein